ncbi:DUF262 domain-containing protein [Enhygromyxa salina]|uniref:GmrSD restriction endonucleases N-terminal domain-containing protein n=1 Tax=Enhygromyxa salina TaxID=215803 RepID=A0A2S9YPQ0_9BACT|nr:DUF262 domain-containing protein [Enhygromyxa salina]PRQ07060.1 hypothetical protein ENSA7_31990 [Enhygromyxa salina]
MRLDRKLDLAVAEGQLRMPGFQRAFRWEAKDRWALLDSIYRGYPVGTLLLWKNPPSATEAGRPLGVMGVAKPQGDRYLVVDGQQRLTTLWRGSAVRPRHALSHVFDRVNSTGKSMRREEVFDALIGSQIAPDGNTGLALVNAQLADLEFGAIEPTTILKAFEAIRGDKVGKLDPRTLNVAAAEADLIRTASALRAAVTFLRATAHEVVDRGSTDSHGNWRARQRGQTEPRLTQRPLQRHDDAPTRRARARTRPSARPCP